MLLPSSPWPATAIGLNKQIMGLTNLIEADTAFMCIWSMQGPVQVYLSTAVSYSQNYLQHLPLCLYYKTLHNLL